MTTTLVEPKARGLAAALQYLKEWEGPEFTIADALELYVVDEDELYLTEDMHKCGKCETLSVERMSPSGFCEECQADIDEWDRDTRMFSGVYGTASGRTL